MSYLDHFENMEIDLPTQHMWSDTQYEIIKKHIQEFERNLDAEHEVGIMLTSFGQSTLMHVRHISYEKSVLIIFKGLVNDCEATLIQHVNQLNFLLIAIKKKEPEKKHAPIGFGPSE